MRLFFGVLLEDDDKNAVYSVINHLKEVQSGKYTDIDNLHITLSFIGEVEPKVSYMLAQIGDKAFSMFPNFSIQASGVNSFKDGKITYLRVLACDTLDILHDRLITLLDESNIVYNRDEVFTPHITLRRGSKIILDQETNTLEIAVRHIALFESKRVDDVLRYIPIKVWDLK